MVKEIRSWLQKWYWKSGLVNRRFPGSGNYWNELYKNGGNSGPGSYNALALFKAEFINHFIKENAVKKVLDLGCGDGNQLSLLQIPEYVGFDVSAEAVKKCRVKFRDDKTKRFHLHDETFLKMMSANAIPDLAISMDVIFHLVEDAVFSQYMNHLFAASEKYVIIYSSSYKGKHVFHERPRNFAAWVSDNIKDWKLISHVANPYPFDLSNPDNTSESDFFVYQKMSG